MARRRRLTPTTPTTPTEQVGVTEARQLEQLEQLEQPEAIMTLGADGAPRPTPVDLTRDAAQPYPHQLFAARAAIYLGGGQALLQIRSEQEGRPDMLRYVAPSSLIKAFNQEQEDTGWLPVQAGAHLLRTGRVGHHPFSVYLIDAHITPLQVSSALTEQGMQQVEVLTVPIPPLLWLGYRTSYSVYALKETPLTIDAPLFEAPFPNIYANHTICWGSNLHLVREASPTGALMALQLFLRESYFTAASLQDRSRAHRHDIREQLRAVAASYKAGQMQVYPLDDLVSRKGKNAATIKSAMELLISMVRHDW